MKSFTELNLGFINAENYRQRANKELLLKYFVRDQYLERRLIPLIPVPLHLVLCSALEAAIFRCGIHEGGRV